MKPYETAILFSPITCFYWLNPHDRWLKPSVLLQKTSYFVKWSKRSQRSATAHSQWAGGTLGQFCWDVFGHTSQLDHEVHQCWSLNSGNINAHKTCTRLGRDGDIWCDIQQTWYEYLTKCCHLTMIIHEIWVMFYFWSCLKKYMEIQHAYEDLELKTLKDSLCISLCNGPVWSKDPPIHLIQQVSLSWLQEVSSATVAKKNPSPANVFFWPFAGEMEVATCNPHFCHSRSKIHRSFSATQTPFPTWLDITGPTHRK